MSDPQRPTLPSVLDSSQPHSSGNDINNFPKPPTSSGIKLPPISFLSNISNLPPSSSNQQSSPASSQLGGGSVSRLLNSSQHDSQPSFQSLLNNNNNNNSDNDKRSMLGSAFGNHSSIPLLSRLMNSTGDDNHSANLSKKPPNKLKEAFNSSPVSLTSLMSSTDGLALPPVKLKEEITKPDIEEESDEAIIKYYEDKYSINDFTDEEKHDILQHEKRARIEKAKNKDYKTYLCYSIIKRLNTVPVKKPVEAVKKPEKESNKAQDTIKFKRREIIINNEEVLATASKFPRKHLGSILYTTSPTVETYRQLAIYPSPEPEPFNKSQTFNITHDRKLPLLPDLTQYINSIITVRIPSYFITDLNNNINFQNRSLWGTDVYTDDSDVLLILKHCGWLPLGEGEIETSLDSDGTKKLTPANLKNPSNVVQTVNNFRQFVNIIGGDIHVDLLILPALKKYEGVYRNGLNSRSWNAKHDGVSISLYGVRYGEKGSAVEGINSAEIRKRKLDELRSVDFKSDFKINKEAWENAKRSLAESEKKE